MEWVKVTTESVRAVKADDYYLVETNLNEWGEKPYSIMKGRSIDFWNGQKSKNNNKPYGYIKRFAKIED